MNLAHGGTWGEPADPPDEARGASTDEAVARLGADGIPVVLEGGDLCRTLGGGPGRRRPGDMRTRVQVDLGVVLIDGRIHRFAAHLVARRSWLAGPLLVVANAAWLGRWLVGPRAHPGDGLLDVTEGNPAPGQRWEASRRARTGNHLPHPDLRTSRVSAAQFDLDPAAGVWLDGQRVARRARVLSVRVEPAAATVYV